jgi:hypothetical protein
LIPTAQTNFKRFKDALSAPIIIVVVCALKNVVQSEGAGDFITDEYDFK